MKLCWENLDHLVLMPGLKGSNEPRLVYFEDVENLVGSKGEHNISEDACKNCGDYFLANKYKDTMFCDKDCKNEYNDNVKESRVTKKYEKVLVDKRKRENGGGWYHLNKDRIPENKVYYDSHNNKISWFLETRRDPEDIRILQTKCCICGTWFSPDRYRFEDISKTANNPDDTFHWGFYCSDKCKNSCPYFNKTTIQIMKQEDRTIKIPKHILYYDWQTELNKKLKPETERYKKRELRRRKKTETELRRIATKIASRKMKQPKDERYERLKRMIYLAKERAKLKGWEFNIDYNWLVDNTPETCPKCGIKFSYDMSIKMNPFAPSIDRIDSNEGYTKDNCIVVSWVYNCGKSSYDEEILYKICKAYLTFQH